jgi:hypothetical protein
MARSRGPHGGARREIGRNVIISQRDLRYVTISEPS